jgi:hypothetical protein
MEALPQRVKKPRKAPQLGSEAPHGREKESFSPELPQVKRAVYVARENDDVPDGFKFECFPRRPPLLTSQTLTILLISSCIHVVSHQFDPDAV